MKHRKLTLPVIIAIAVVLLSGIGIVGALNGWFGGGAKIPDDTWTRGLVGYWDFEESNGPLVFDKSGQGNDGMLNDGGSGTTISYWTFDEGSGSAAYDWVGSNNGALTNGPVWSSSGKVGGALYFDGKDDYVNAGTDLSLAPTSAITVQAWVYPETFTNNSYPRIVDRRMGSPGGYNLMGASDNKFAWEIFNASSYKVNSSTGYAVNRWYHVVGTYDGVDLRIYVNGVLDCTPLAWVGTVLASDVMLAIGSASDQTQFFNGLIDDVRIYDYARSADDIRKDYLETYKTKFTDGKVGNAMEFDGVDDYVEIPNSNDWRGDDFTLEFWGYQENGNGISISCHNGASGAGGWYIAMYPADNPSGNDFGGGSGSSFATSSADMKEDDWNHMVASVSGSSATFYVNGILQGTFNVGNNRAGANNLNLVRDSNTGVAKGPTKLDEVRIYNRALSVEEIRYHYNRGGPVAHWKFNEGNGTTTYDSTDNGNDGYFQTTASSPTWTTGVEGTGLLFDGVDDYVNMGSNSSLTSLSQGTIEAWIKSNSESSISSIFSVSDSDDADSMVQLRWRGDNGDKLGFRVVEGGTYSLRMDTNASMSENTWHHVAVAIDSSGNKLYVDGVEQAVTYTNGNSSAQKFFSDVNDIDAIRIGSVKFSSAEQQSFDGLIDNVRIYNYARSAEEIRLDYNQGFAIRFGGSPADDMTRGLVGYWNMDESNGGFVYDQSDYQNTGYARPYGQSLSFDGVDDGVNLGTGASLNLTTGATWEAWVNVPSFKSESWLFSSVGCDHRFVNNQLHGNWYGLVGGSPTSLDLYPTPTLSTNTWYHIVYTFDGAAAVGSKAGAYLNGVDVTPSNSWAATSLNVRDVNRLGYSGYSALSFWGLIDEVRIYNRALSAEEIIEHYKGIYGNETGLVGYWPFNEGYGTKAYDQSGKGNHGTLVSGPAWKNNAPRWTEGKVRGALQFDGVDDYIYRPISNFRSSDQQGTIEAWIKTTSTGNQKIFSSSDEATDNYWLGFWVEANGVFRVYQINNDTADILYTGSTSALDGNWHHAVLTSNGSAYSIYVDGVLQSLSVGGGSNSGDWFADISGRDNWTIGILKRGSGIVTPFNGSIDEVRVYNRALSVEEIRYHYNRGGPVAHWKFNEGNGTTTYDSTDNGNDGYFQTTASSPIWTTGIEGTGLLFDGVDDYVDCGNGSTLDIGTDNVTYMAWFKTTATYGASGYDPIIVCRDDDSGHSRYCLMVSEEAYVRFYVRDTEDDIIDEQTSSSYNDGNWHHAAMVRTSARLKGYVDGVEVADVDASAIGDIDNETKPLKIGGNIFSRYFNGLIDDVRIYNYARTAAEVRTDYNQGFAVRFGGSPADDMTRGLVSYWSMDEGAGATSTDLSGQGNDGTLTNGPKWTTGRAGGALEFDGVDDYVNCGDGVSLSPSSITIEAWVNFKDIGTRGIVSKRQSFGVNDEYNLFYNGVDLAFHARIGGQSVAGKFAYYTITPALGQWYHVVQTFDGTTIKIYVNGVNGTDGTPGVGITDGGQSLRIGNLNVGLCYFNGLIDEVRIYNRALSAEEIRYHYNRGGPVAHWTFDEGSGQTAYDGGRTSANNDGILGGSTSTESSDPTWTIGKYGSALSFDGADDYVQATVSQGTTTVSFWMQSAGGAWQHISNSNGTYYIDGTQSQTAPSTYPIYFSGATVQIGKTGASAYFNGLIDDVRIYNYARTAEQIQLDYNQGLSAHFK